MSRRRARCRAPAPPAPALLKGLAEHLAEDVARPPPIAAGRRRCGTRSAAPPRAAPAGGGSPRTDRRRRRALETLETRLALGVDLAAIEGRAVLLVADDLIGLVGRGEASLAFGIVGILVRVVLLGELAVSRLDVLGRRVSWQRPAPHRDRACSVTSTLEFVQCVICVRLGRDSRPAGHEVSPAGYNASKASIRQAPSPAAHASPLNIVTPSKLSRLASKRRQTVPLSVYSVSPLMPPREPVSTLAQASVAPLTASTSADETRVADGGDVGSAGRVLVGGALIRHRAGHHGAVDRGLAIAEARRARRGAAERDQKQHGRCFSGPAVILPVALRLARQSSNSRLVPIRRDMSDRELTSGSSTGLRFQPDAGGFATRSCCHVPLLCGSTCVRFRRPRAPETATAHIRRGKTQG